MEEQQEKESRQILKKTGNAVMWISGGKMIATSLKKAGGHAEESLSRMRTLADIIREKLERKPGRTETFEEAIVNHGLTEQVLEEKRKQCVQMLWFVTPLLPFAVFYFFYQLGLGHAFPTFVGFSALALSGAVTFRNAFFIWQIDKRYLGTPKEFIQSGEWMPGSARGDQE